MLIKSTTHPLVKELCQLQKSSKARKELQSLLIEGKKLAYEVCMAGGEYALFTTDPKSVPHDINPEKVIEISDAVCQKISGTRSPEGVFAKIPMPKKRSLVGLSKVLVLDGVSDPGNLGSLFRSALAFGFEGVLLLANCCDPWNDKALRASRGAALSLPFQHGAIEELDLPLFGADIGGTSVREISPPKKFALVLGNEGQGLSKDVKKSCELITIPMCKEVESLNVSAAGAILMHHFQEVL